MEELLKTDTEIVINDKTSLGRSRLWDFQRDYYESNTIDAWDKKRVPHYITSNPAIADSYANSIIRFIQDCQTSGNSDPELPFYIVELGAGAGIFSFYTINRLFELKEKLAIDIPIVYVMTDLVQANIDFWRTHESFQSYIISGKLDFAFFDAEYSKELNLLNAGIIIPCENNPGKVNPVVLIANYVFDSLRQDVFFVKNGILSEGLCKLTTNQSNVVDNKIDRLDQVKVSLTFSETQLPYYNYDFLNELLFNYQQTANDEYVSLPVGSLICLENFRKLSNNRLLVITSDKGFAKHSEIIQKMPPVISFHDNCFSLSVNFDALNCYFKAFGGETFMQSTSGSLNTYAFISGFQFERMPETSLALQTYINTLGHASVYYLFTNYGMKPGLSVESMVRFLEISRWDVQVFSNYRDRIIQQLKSGCARIPEIEYLKEKVQQVEKNIYKLPNAIDSYFDIALFFQETGDYREALKFYQKSILHFDEKDSTLFNMGLCHYFLKEPDLAILQFSEAIKLNPNYVMARGWISQIESELSKEKR